MFQILLPGVLTLTPRTPKANLLVFIPPATLSQMEYGVSPEQSLKARSQRPDLLVVESAPRPVFSTEHVKAALERIAFEQHHSNNIVTLLRNLSLMMENEAQASLNQAFGNGLIWSVGIKSLPTAIGRFTCQERLYPFNRRNHTLPACGSLH